MPDEKDEAHATIEKSSVKLGQHYRHFKGGEYEIVCLAIKEDTLEPLVVYKSLTHDYIWARTLENFTETVELNGKTVKRFTLL
jgi:hypothetical protein